ncbi:MAG TPA: fatty acyl-AMP ligase [Candidatus Angelobacter sp.]|jgi:acyl-CoA synthetase (AMP-forming)/AMP-acid ligase II|nr:fatty acyl-AMP ligase [Candidatus Angelobacter sp.]
MDTVLEARNFVDVLRYWVNRQPDKCVFVYLGREGRLEMRITYEQLDRRARAIAAALQEVAYPGERALLLYPSGLDYVEAVMGCLYAGIVAVPSCSPKRSGRPYSSRKAQWQAVDAKPALVLTSCELKSEVEGLQWRTGHEAARVLFTDLVADDQCRDWLEVKLEPQTLACLQYTSGSTSAPKGVMVRHANLLHNQECMRCAFGHDEESVIVNWLPLDHHIGLIGGVLQPIYAGAQGILLSPLDFLRRPLTWLETISRFHATTSGGPDFAYDLCLKKIKPEEREGLDLRSWKVAFNSTEHVRPDTVVNFSSEFGACGFRLHAFRPCYGLAEAAVMVTAGDGSSILFSRAGSDSQNDEGNGTGSSRMLVGCGRIQHHQIAIVNPENLQRCAADEIGEVWISSASVAGSYWNREKENMATFGAYIKDRLEGPFLRTGDLGLEHNQQLFIVGRLNDLITTNGRNYYPEDLELVAQECHEGLVRGCGAAFAIDKDGSQSVVLVQEVSRMHRITNTQPIAKAIHRAILRKFDLHIGEVVLVPEDSIPRTSSGNFQRHECRKLFLDGTLNRVAASGSDEALAEINMFPSRLR